MAESPSNREEYSTQGIPCTTAQPDASPDRVAERRSSWSSEQDSLRGEARRLARSWETILRGRGPRALLKKWRTVSQCIQDVCGRYGTLAPARRVEDRDAEWLRDNLRLLRGVVRELRNALKATGKLPEVPSNDGRPVKRVYTAATSYLRATGGVFEEKSFLTFLACAQQRHPLEISELWALKPLLQLVLLEEIVRIAASGINDEHRRSSEQPGRAPRPFSCLPSLINGLREVGDCDWKGIFEKLSAVERILREDPSGTYALMDFESRDIYRKAVQDLAASSEASEVETAQKAIGLARAAQGEWSSHPRVKERRRHVGYYLADKGRGLLEKQIRYSPPLAKQIERVILAWPEVCYFVGIELLTFAIIAFVVGGVLDRVPLILGLFLLLLPASEAALGAINQVVMFLLPPRALPKLDLSAGIPSDKATLVVVPTLLTDADYVIHMARQLEVHYLATRDPNLHFALLTDSPDSSQPTGDQDELVGFCANLIEDLNRKYASKNEGSFFLFHRHRVFNAPEGTWMGWERKRGKLLDLNNLLRGNPDSFPVTVGDLSILPKVRYVITLDSDTQLPRGVAHRLVGTLAHPLNQAVIDPKTNTVVEGYGILQPRVGISVQAASRSLLANIYSGQTGFDPYTCATSDVYQDLFGEGSFTGKGIYEVDIFQTVLSQRFPCNAILSHDLIEGTYARAGLVSDIEVIDDYPSHFSAYSRRKHRWVRGDWQIVLWLLPRVPDFRGRMVSNPLSLLSRWKILDNLRRSVLETATFALLVAGWSSLPGDPLRWTVATLILLLIPTYVQLALSLLWVARAESRAGYLKGVAQTFVTGQVNAFFLLAFLLHQMLVTLDAIVRTIVRLTITRQRLLEWETAAEAERGSRKTPVDVYLRWTPWLSLLIGSALALTKPSALPAALPLLVLWACSNRLARWLNQPLRPARTEISSADEEFIRKVGLRTWRFFRQLTQEEGCGLVPDNIQEAPPAVAHRISPTNLGLLLDSQYAAFELGYLTLPEFVSEVEKSLATAKRLERYRGHFYNWYDTRTLEPLAPFFVSTVDSGNLACCLWTLKQACLRLIGQPLFRAAVWRGLRDHANLMEEIAREAEVSEDVSRRISQLVAWLDVLGESNGAWIRFLPGIEELLLQIECDSATEAGRAPELRWWVSQTLERIRNARGMIGSLAPWLSPERSDLARTVEAGPDATALPLTLESLPAALADMDGRLQDVIGASGIDASVRLAASLVRQMLPSSMAEGEHLVQRLRTLADDLEGLVQEMDFRFLYNRRRRTLSIGFDVPRQRLEPGCYDLLASEARSAAFVAIAKGDIPPESWFQMGRAHIRWQGEQVLCSWSGTMFEYLMPTLWLKNYPCTILDRTSRAVVRCQQKWAEAKGLPWGISEAAYNARDSAGHYQYRPFGIPVLALQGLIFDERVVSPYATFLALPIDPHAAVRNLRRMEHLNWLGRFGFYEAADFAPSRINGKEEHALVRCWMAHHQGMSLLALCNLLADGVFHTLFHAEPAVAATELLLHEKLSRAIRVERAEEEAFGAPFETREETRGGPDASESPLEGQIGAPYPAVLRPETFQACQMQAESGLGADNH